MGSCTSLPKTSKMQNLVTLNKKEINSRHRSSVDTNIDNKSNHKSNVSQNKKATESSVKITLYPDIEELLLPIYLKANSQILITVQGKWSFYPEGDLCFIKGHENTCYNNFNIGQLFCKVQGGVSFPITKRTTVYKSNSNGQLILYANTDKCSVTSSGSLDITIEGATMMTQEQIDIESGWRALYKPPKIVAYLTKNEYELVNLINKIRVNPHKFAKQYLDIVNEPDASHCKETYDLLINYTPIPPLDISEALSSAAKSHCEDIGSKGITGHMSTVNNNTIKQRIMKYSLNSPILYFGENCSYGKQQPLSIALDMIIDSGLRNKYNQMNILNEGFNSIGVSILKHYSFKWMCVIVFAKDIRIHC